MHEVVFLLESVAQSREDIKGLMRAFEALLMRSERHLTHVYAHASDRGLSRMRTLRDDVQVLHRDCATRADLVLALADLCSVRLGEVGRLLCEREPASPDYAPLAHMWQEATVEVEAARRTATVVKLRFTQAFAKLDAQVRLQEEALEASREVSRLIERLR